MNKALLVGYWSPFLVTVDVGRYLMKAWGESWTLGFSIQMWWIINIPGRMTCMKEVFFGSGSFCLDPDRTFLSPSPDPDPQKNSNRIRKTWIHKKLPKTLSTSKLIFQITLNTILFCQDPPKSNQRAFRSSKTISRKILNLAFFKTGWSFYSSKITGCA